MENDALVEKYANEVLALIHLDKDQNEIDKKLEAIFLHLPFVIGSRKGELVGKFIGRLKIQESLGETELQKLRDVIKKAKEKVV